MDSSKTLHVTLVTPTGPLAHVQAARVVAPTVWGQITLLPEHICMLTELGEGILELHTEMHQDGYVISGGLMEIDQNNVTILADSAQRLVT